MTPDERNLLGRFLQDLAASRGGAKDAEAAALIDRSVQTNPDAAYLLVQHALIADQALHAAQARIAELEARGPGPAQGGGFGGVGPWANQPQPAPQPGYAQPTYAPPPTYAPQPARGGLLGGLFGGGQAAPVQNGGFGSFLRQAGTTAAGVAGGEMLFGGLSDLFGGHRGYGYGGGPQEMIVNNYGGGGYGPDQGFDPGQDGYDDGGFGDGGYDDGGVG